MSKYRVAVGATLEFRGKSPARDLLEEAGCEVIAQKPKSSWTREEIREKLVGADAILAGSENLNAATMDQADRLKIVARNGVGYDRVDLDYCTERGIVVTTTPGALSDAVADLTFALLLGLVRHLVAGDSTVKAGGYEVPFGEDLAAMTLGVIGGGNIGSEVVRRAQAFRMRVLVHDPWVDPARIEAQGAAPVSLDELLQQSDVVSLHIPLNPENSNLVDADFLSRMKPNSYLINTARGGLVDEEALIAALDSGHLAGAGLDCQAAEPPQGLSLELVRLDKVIAMPHSGSKTYTTRVRMSTWAAQSIVDVLQGRVPKHVVNREALEKLDLRE